MDFSILEDQQQQQISQHDNSLSQNYAAKLNIGMPMDIGKNESNDGGVEEVAETLNFCNALNERVFSIFDCILLVLSLGKLIWIFGLTD